MQPVRLTIAAQVVQPDGSRLKATTKATRTQGNGVLGLTKREGIQASLWIALLIVCFAVLVVHRRASEIES